MWFIGVEVEQETSAPPPKNILDPPLLLGLHNSSYDTKAEFNNCFIIHSK